MTIALRGGIRTALTTFRQTTTYRNFLRYSTTSTSSNNNDKSTTRNVDDETVMVTHIQPRVVVYDGACHTCHEGVKWIINADKDKNIKFCCIQSKAARPYMKVSGALNRSKALHSYMFVEEPSITYTGYEVAPKILSYLPQIYRDNYYSNEPMTDASIFHVPKQRYDWYGRKDNECIVLKEPKLLERFVDSEELLKRRSALNYDDDHQDM